MEPKRFIGSDLRRLYERIRRELGPDAIVIRTRSLMREGAEPLTEILAAAVEGEAEYSLAFQQGIAGGLLARLEQGQQPLTVGDLEDLVARDTAPAPAPVPLPAADAGEAPEWLQGFVANAPEAPLAAAYAAEEQGDAAIAAPGRRRTFYLPEEEPPADLPASGWGRRPEPVTLLRPGLANGRERDDHAPGRSPGLIAGLVEAGLSPAAARIVFESASWESDGRRALAATLEQRRVRYPDETQTAIVTMQGPAGAGKTTALVRMALDCSDAGRDALLVAADTAHVGARGQLHAYAEATGLPIADAFDHREISRVTAKARRGTCVFVDLPAGPWEAPRSGQVASFNYLALPAHWQAAALEMAIGQFTLAPFAGCVLTGTDLVTDLSPVLSTVVEARLGIAFLSSGRDVSTGIGVADPLTLASGMFTIRTGETTDGRLVATA